MQRFTDEEFLMALNRVVEGKGDYVYEVDLTDHMRRVLEAKNTIDPDEAPYSYEGCIVGQTVRELDPRYYQRMLDVEVELGSGFSVGMAPAKVTTALRRRFTIGQYAALRKAQEYQDGGARWSAAKEAAIKELNTVNALHASGHRVRYNQR